MSEKTENQYRDGLFELAAVAVGGLTRVGLSVASMTLITLPTNERKRVRKAMGELAMSIVSVPKEFADLSERVVDRVFEEETQGMPRTPSAEQVVSGAREFTGRLARAADNFTASVRVN